MIKKNINMFISYIKKLYMNYKKEQEQLKQYQQQQQQAYIAQCNLFSLQRELGNVLTNRHFSSKMHTLKSYQELTPLTVCPVKSTVLYRFAVSKTNPDEVTPKIILKQIQNKINQHIKTQHLALLSEYNMLHPFSQEALLNEHLLLYRGFQVVKITDDANDLLLDVVIF